VVFGFAVWYLRRAHHCGELASYYDVRSGASSIRGLLVAIAIGVLAALFFLVRFVKWSWFRD